MDHLVQEDFSKCPLSRRSGLGSASCCSSCCAWAAAVISFIDTSGRIARPLLPSRAKKVQPEALPMVPQHHHLGHAFPGCLHHDGCSTKIGEKALAQLSR